MIFPLIKVESKMEQKDIYMTLMMQSASYVPLDQKIAKMKAAAGLGKAVVKDPSARAPCLCGSKVADAKRKLVHGYEVIYAPKNGNTAPTMIIHTAALSELSTQQQQEIIADMIKQLNVEVEDEHWRTDATPTFITKGCCATRGSTRLISSEPSEIADFIVRRGDAIDIATVSQMVIMIRLNLRVLNRALLPFSHD